MKWIPLMLVLVGCADGDTFRRPSAPRSPECAKYWGEVEKLERHIAGIEVGLGTLIAECHAARARGVDLEERRFRAPRPDVQELTAARDEEEAACSRSGAGIEGITHSEEHLMVERQAAEGCEARRTRKREAWEQ